MLTLTGRLSERQRRTLTRSLSLVLLVLGVLGFSLFTIQPPPAGAPSLTIFAGYGYLFGALPVNALHSILRIALGAAGLVLAGNNVTARLYSRGIAVFYGAFAILGCIPIKSLFACSSPRGMS